MQKLTKSIFKNVKINFNINNIQKKFAGDNFKSNKFGMEENKGAKFANMNTNSNKSQDTDEAFNMERMNNPNSRTGKPEEGKSNKEVIDKKTLNAEDNIVTPGKVRQNLESNKDSKLEMAKKQGESIPKDGNLGDKTLNMKDNIQAGKEDLVEGKERDEQGRKDSTFAYGDNYKFDLKRDEFSVQDDMAKQRELNGKADPKMNTVKKNKL